MRVVLKHPETFVAVGAEQPSYFTCLVIMVDVESAEAVDPTRWAIEGTNPTLGLKHVIVVGQRDAVILPQLSCPRAVFAFTAQAVKGGVLAEVFGGLRLFAEDTLLDEVDWSVGLGQLHLFAGQPFAARLATASVATGGPLVFLVGGNRLRLVAGAALLQGVLARFAVDNRHSTIRLSCPPVVMASLT